MNAVPRGSSWRAAQRGAGALLAMVCALGVAACATPASRSTACVTISAGQGGELLAAIPVPPDNATLRLAYLHSVTLSPVEERYEVAGRMLIQTELRFSEHGPGLPTQPDAGQAWAQEDGQFVLRLTRSFDGIAARVDPAQAPTLSLGARRVDLAQWGRRPIYLAARPGRCPQP